MSFYAQNRHSGSAAPELTRRVLPGGKVHGANMGPIWGRQDPGGPMLAPWTLLFGLIFAFEAMGGISNWMVECRNAVVFQNNTAFFLSQISTINAPYLTHNCKIWGVLWQKTPHPIYCPEELAFPNCDFHEWPVVLISDVLYNYMKYRVYIGLCCSRASQSW